MRKSKSARSDEIALGHEINRLFEWGMEKVADAVDARLHPPPPPHPEPPKDVLPPWVNPIFKPKYVEVKEDAGSTH